MRDFDDCNANRVRFGKRTDARSIRVCRASKGSTRSRVRSTMAGRPVNVSTNASASASAMSGDGPFVRRQARTMPARDARMPLRVAAAAIRGEAARRAG